MAQLQNPGAGLQPLKDAAAAGINTNYAGAEDAIRSKFAAGGRRGNTGTALRQAEYSRIGALNGLESDFARMTLDRDSQAKQLAMAMLGMNFGQDTTGSFSSQSNGQSTTNQTTVQQGNPLAGGLQGGLSTLMYLQNLMAALGGL